MQVNGGPGDVTQADAIQKPPRVPAVGGQGGSEQPAADPGAASRTDQVEISDAGRALANDAATEQTESSALDPQRVADIRAKILSGAYNSLSMASDVARAILRSGDL